MGPKLVNCCKPEQVGIKELGPEDVDVDFRRILKEARNERGRKT